MNKNNYFLTIGCFFIVSLLVSLFYYLHSSDSKIDWEAYTLIDHSEHQIDNDRFQNNWLLIYFGFTRCNSSCPIQMNVMSTTVRELKESFSKLSITPIFITLDAENDSTQVMAQYVKSIGSDFVGITGSQREIDRVASSFKVFFSKTSAIEIDHSNVIYVVSPDRTIIERYIGNQTTKNLVASLNELIEPS